MEDIRITHLPPTVVVDQHRDKMRPLGKGVIVWLPLEMQHQTFLDLGQLISKRLLKQCQIFRIRPPPHVGAKRFQGPQLTDRADVIIEFNAAALRQVVGQ